MLTSLCGLGRALRTLQPSLTLPAGAMQGNAATATVFGGLFCFAGSCTSILCRRRRPVGFMQDGTAVMCQAWRSYTLAAVEGSVAKMAGHRHCLQVCILSCIAGEGGL